MKRSLAVVLLAFATQLNAGWIEFSAKSNGDVFFFDDSRVEREDDRINVWTRVRYKRSVMAASSYQSLVQINCAENTERILQDTFYTDKDWNKPAMATNMNAKPKQAIRRNSATKALAELLCAK